MSKVKGVYLIEECIDSMQKQSDYNRTTSRMLPEFINKLQLALKELEEE